MTDALVQVLDHQGQFGERLGKSSGRPRSRRCRDRSPDSEAEFGTPSGYEPWGPVSPDNVHETGVSLDGQSTSPIVAAQAQQVEPTRTKTWSRARSEVFVPYSHRPSLPALA